MHTAIVIAVGLLVLTVRLVVGHLLAGPGALPTVALVFLPVWLVGATVNLAIGAKRAGYTVGGETPVFGVVFAVPGPVALFLRRRLQ